MKAGHVLQLGPDTAPEYFVGSMRERVIANRTTSISEALHYPDAAAALSATRVPAMRKYPWKVVLRRDTTKPVCRASQR